MPATPTITITDNQDATATISISGSDVGTTNTVYYAPINYHSADGSNWTSGGSRLGDGDVTVTPLKIRNTGGIYLWRVESDDGVVAHSNILQNRVSSETLDPYTRVLEAAHGIIQAAGLQGLSTNDIHLQTVPDAISHRMLIVAPTEPEKMIGGTRGGTNHRDDHDYPVTVVHVDTANRSQSADNRQRWMKWRYEIAALFRNQHLTGVTEVNGCTINYRRSMDGQAWFKANQCVGALVLNFRTRVERGL